MKIRKINIDDLETLRNLSIQTFKETFEEVNTEEDMQKYLDENLSIEKLKTELENLNSEFYFAENNDEILGYLKLNFKDAQTEKLEENHFEIERIYVLKAFLGQKIGQILFDKAIRNRERKRFRRCLASCLGRKITEPYDFTKKMVLKSSEYEFVLRRHRCTNRLTHEN